MPDFRVIPDPGVAIGGANPTAAAKAAVTKHRIDVTVPEGDAPRRVYVVEGTVHAVEVTAESEDKLSGSLVKEEPAGPQDVTT